MGKRKESIPEKESVEEKVLKKYRKSKKEDNTTPTEDSEELNDSKGLIEENSDLKVSENDSISAEKIFKKVKKIKDEETKNAIKLRKQSRKLAKSKAAKLAEEKPEESTGNKSVSAITYLNDWKYKKDVWKFKKSLQIWLLRNWQNFNKINDKDFDLFVEYIFAISSESLAKKRLETEAKELVDKQTEDKDKDDEQNEKIVERARRILQCY